MDQITHQVLQLKIRNTEVLYSGNTTEHIFDHVGGMLGSNQNSEWQIQDLHKNILGAHAQIDYRDGSYFILSLGNKLFVNYSEISSHVGAVKLQNNDEIRIGNLIIRVRIGININELINDPLNKSPEQIISMNENTLDDMFKNDVEKESQYQLENDLLSTPPTEEIIDPFKAIEKDSQDELTLFYMNKASNTNIYSSSRNITVTDYNAQSKESDLMNNNFMEIPDTNTKLRNDDSYDIKNVNLSLTHFLRGLDIPLNIPDTDEASVLLEELGETLKATIEGLLKLNRSKDVLKNKNLRPIEDNPLRLNQSYADTMALLFSDQLCSVYLSAPVAVKESLENVAIHNRASENATKFALSAMLDAFSPEQLLKRFEAYRNSRKVKFHDGAWSWNMYRSYYKELSSNRQQGFEKLFWEHYEQEYDRQLRLLNQERLENA